MFDGVYDAVVVGFGPCGAGMTALLGRLGHRVIAVERHTTRYHLARTGKLDAEVMRIYQSLGCADRVLDQTLPVVSRHYLNADGVELASFRINGDTPPPSGWHEYLMCWQPDVEDIVAETTEGFPGVEVLRGWEVSDLQDRGEIVEVDISRSEGGPDSTRRPTGETVRLRTRFVIGADGANSVVREKAGIELEDFGVRWDWLVVDTKPTQEMPNVLTRVGDHAIPYGPFVYQVFDPSRPRKTMPLGRDHLRFEFALLSPEELARSSDPAFGYELLAQSGGTPDNMEIVRQAAFPFQGKLASSYRSGRMFIAGDAAHLMPPYLGSGMATGLRDVCNLSWKLSLALRGKIELDLLDTYEQERRPHARAYIEGSIEYGKLSNTRDPAVAAERDAAFLRGHNALAIDIPGLENGLLYRTADGTLGALTGTLAPQASVVVHGRAGRFDDVFGAGRFCVIGYGFDPRLHLSEEQLGFLERMEAIVVSLVVDPSEATSDSVGVCVDGTYPAFFDKHSICALLVRPDFYVFGAAHEPSEVASIVSQLEAHLVGGGVAPSQRSGRVSATRQLSRPASPSKS